MPEPKSKQGGRVWGLYQQGVKDRGREGEIGDIWDIEEGRRERRKAQESEASASSGSSGGSNYTSRLDGDGRTHRSAPTKGDGRTNRASLQRATRGEDVVLQPDVERVPHSPLDPRKKGLELARLSDTPSGVWLGRPWGSSTVDVLSGRGEDKGAKMSQTLGAGDFTFGGRGRGAVGSYRKSEEEGERDVFGAQMDRIARETERMGGKAFAESRAREDADRRANPISYGLQALSGRYGRDTIDAVTGSSDEEKTLYATNRVLGDYKNDRRLVERVVSGKEGWLSRMGKTFADDMDGGMKLLDFGVEDAVTTRAITLAMAKFDKVGREGLSQAERNLLDAVAVRDTYRAFYEEQLGDNWSGAGRVTAEALPFVRDMVLGGGLSGAARGAAGGAAKASAKEAAKGVVKGAVRRYLGEWLKKAPGQIVGTLAIEMPRVAGGAEERMHGRLVAERLDGDDGGVSATSAGSASSRGRRGDTVGFGGRREGAEKSYGVALAKALGDQAIEVVSETLGEPMMKGLGLAGRAVFKPLAKSGVGKAVGGVVSELGAKLGSRPTARAVGRFYTGAKRTLAPMREMTRVGGFAEEFLEEQVGGTANALLIGDQSMSDVWGLSGMEQTAVALLPMQVAFGGVGAVGSTARLGQVNGAVRRSAESLRAQGGDVDALQGRLRACSYVELEDELLSRHTKLDEVVSRLRDESLGVEERQGLEGDARRVGAELRYVSNWMSREMLVGASESDIEEARGKLESDLESRRRAVLEDEFANGDVLVHRDDAGDVVDYEVVEVTYGPNDAKGYLVSGAVRDGKVCLEDGSRGAVVVRGADGREQVHSDDVRVARVLGRDAVDQGVQAKVVADMEGRMQAVSGMMDAYEKGVLELSRDDVEGVVRDVMGRLGVEVPWRVMSREEVEAEGGKLDGSERGWYDERSGEVVILSDGVSRKSVEHTVLHEVVGHRGLAALFDRKALYDYFDSVWESMSDRDREEIATLYPGLSTSDLASEYIAHQAETYSNPGVWARIVAGFRQLLDGLGLSLKVSDGDIRMMLSHGVRAMQKGRENQSDQSNQSDQRAQSQESELEAVNDRFNSELSEQIGGRQSEGHVYRLGLPSAVLRGAGVPNLPIELSASRLRSKSEQSNHPFDMSAVRDLPRALSSPLAVFAYGDGSKSQNVIVELESGGQNFLVGIFFNESQRGLEVNDIRGLFPKDTSGWLNWITQGKLRYVDKKRVLNLIAQRRTNFAEVDYLDLELATKVVKGFENPKESEEKVSKSSDGAGIIQKPTAKSQEQDETARDVVERGVRERRYRRRREADRELMGRKLSPTERAFVGRMERLRERYGQSVSLDAGGTMWGLSGVIDNSLVQRRERVKTEWVDATNPIRVYEERVGALSGRPVEGSRSVWMRYNQTSSRATSKIEELEGGVYRELAQKLREVSRALGLTGEQLDDYLFAKHAPERNAYMRRRGVEQRLAKLDAKHAEDEGWLDSSARRKAEAKYKAKEAELEYAYETQLGEDIPVHFAGHELLDGVEGAQDLVEQFEEAMRSRGLSVEELWEAVRRVNDAILVVWRDCGMMSQEAYEAVSGMYEWYVPMQGFAEESRGDYEYMHDHVGGFVQPIQRAKGRVSRPDRPLLAMYRKIRSAVIGGYHNVEKQAFYGLVSNYPSDYTSLGRQYYSVGEDGLLTPLYPSSFASEDIEAFEDRMREGLADGTVTLIRERGARVAYLTDARSLGEHVVKVMIGGREHLVFVNGRPDLAQAVNRINVGEDTDVERFAKGLLRGMAQNVTSRNPNFMVVNLLRDAQMSLAVNFLKRGGVYTRAYMRNYLRVSPLVLGRIWGKGRTGVGVSSDVEAYWDEFKRFGGQTGYARLLSEHKARRRVNSLLDAGGKGRAVRVGEDVLNLFARPNEMIESWGRFATYVTSREMGRSVTESISDAKEVSVNFNRKGAGRSGLYRLIGACQMFFNAGVQGMNLAYGVAVENPWGSSAVVASLMVLGYAVAALQDGDDDHGDVYRAINPAVRKSNMCFVVDKDSYVKVPLAIEMRAFYGMGQELYGLVSGKQDAVEAVLGSMDSMGEIVAYNPTNGASPLAGMVAGQRRGESVGSSLYRGGRGFVPAQIQPITDLLANQNFYGGALRWESRYVDRSLPLYKRLPKHTPEWQVAVSKWINGIGQDKYVSEWRHGVLSPLSDPLVYSYLCSQYFGGIVQMLDQVDRAVAADGVRGAVSASPVTNRFYRYDDSLRGRGIEERFWELRRDVESRSKVQRGMRESLEGARSMREYDARSRAIVEYGGGVDYEMLEGWFRDFDKLYKEYKSHRGMLTDEEDRAWRGELQQVEAEMYSEIRGYMLAVGG